MCILPLGGDRMQISKFFSRLKQRFVAGGKWFVSLFRFRKGNLLDTVLRSVLVLALLVIIGGWLTTTFIFPNQVGKSPDDNQNGVSQIDLATAVKDELQRLLDTEYAWLVEQQVTPVGISSRIEPETPSRPEPDQMRPDVAVEDAVETLTVTFDQILWPVKGQIESEYGWQRNPVTNEWRFNSELQFNTEVEEQVRSVLAGRVEQIVPDQHGFEVVIEHGSGWHSVYRGIRAVMVGIGDMVGQNQLIANTGADGQLCFAMLYEGDPINPQQYMSLY